MQEGIALERGMLTQLRALADQIVDTTRMNVHELRDVITAKFGPRQDPGSPYSGVISLFATALGVNAQQNLQAPTAVPPPDDTARFLAGMPPSPGSLVL